MKPLLVGAVMPLIERLLDRIPDPAARDRARAEAERELMATLAAADAAQVELNRTEAQHRSVFVAGWRPFIGWVCGTSLAWAFLAQPALAWLAALLWPDAAPPPFAADHLLELVLAMLGLGGLRSWEKGRGVTR